MFSFAKSFITLVLAATGVLSLAVNTPIYVQAGAPLIITWTSTPTDPQVDDVQSVFPLALANNVDPSSDVITVIVPNVPAGYTVLLSIEPEPTQFHSNEYILKFVSISNINQVFTTSGAFGISPAA
ncbi:hypothetical protein DFH09DRAFT_1290723 [Mycena vulgaris]|nr:hypothetical protein DFH09DRAFT_1290723 [Mycena vulgaris]